MVASCSSKYVFRFHCEQMDPASLTVLGTAHLFPIHGNGHRTSQTLGPIGSQLVEHIRVLAFQNPCQGSRVRGSEPIGSQLIGGIVSGIDRLVWQFSSDTRAIAGVVNAFIKPRQGGRHATAIQWAGQPQDR